MFSGAQHPHIQPTYTQIQRGKNSQATRVSYAPTPIATTLTSSTTCTTSRLSSGCGVGMRDNVRMGHLQDLYYVNRDRRLYTHVLVPQCALEGLVRHCGTVHCHHDVLCLAHCFFCCLALALLLESCLDSMIYQIPRVDPHGSQCQK